MTNVVKKGSGRASHKAKTDKAAQRTPLPAKKTAAKKVADKAPGPKAPAKRSAKPRAPKVAALPASSVSPDWPGWGKAQAWLDYATMHGWASTVEYPNKHDIVVVSTKGDETIKVPYFSGKQSSDNPPTWTAGGRVVSLRNVGGARGHADGSRMVKRDVVKRVTKTVAVSEATEDLDKPGLLSEMSDNEVLAAVAGRQITWKNGLSSIYDDDRVLPAIYCPECGAAKAEGDDSKEHRTASHTRDWKVQRAWKVEAHPHNGKMIFHFRSADTLQYRAVYVDKIVRVS